MSETSHMREIYLHTIALEPARWTPARVSAPLAALLPEIVRHGFRKLEIYEPHLSMAPDESVLPVMIGDLGIEPVILSSYATLSPSTDGETFVALADEMAARVARFGFRKVRLFPGQRVDPADDAAVAVVQERIAKLASRMPETELLLETHDRSIADDPARIVRMVEELALPTVGLLFQPTLFERESSLSQFALQKSLVRHLHLQDRNAAREMVLLGEGMVPWEVFLRELGADVPASIEFVAAGMTPVAEFDLGRALAGVAADMKVAREMAGRDATY